MRKISSFFLLLLLVLSVVYANSQELITIPDIENLQKAKVSSILDGDTINTYKYAESIRLIGIDAPENKAGSKPISEYGYKSYQFVKDRLVNIANRNIYLEFDEDKFDDYGRVLAYVYYEDEEGNLILLNEEILKNGLARPLFYEDTSKKQEIFVKAYIQAYEDRKGIFEKYDDESLVVESDALTQKDLGRMRWVKAKVKDVIKEGENYYKIISEGEDFYYGIRKQEFDAFFDGYDIYDLVGEEVMFWGEIWLDQRTGQYEILGRAPFEIKRLSN
jgi:micrococcal nuclease